jgi:calcium/calmodulin-dependent protein kinase I
LSEIKVLKQLHHPNVVGLVDLYIKKDEYYIIMDLASGGHLFERILEKGHYTEMHAAGLVRQLLGALAYIHDVVGENCHMLSSNL